MASSSSNPVLDEIRANRLRPTKTVDKSKPAFLRADDASTGKKTSTGFKKARSAQPGLESDENTAPPPPPPPAVAPPPPPLLAPPDSGMKRATSNPSLSKLGGKNPQQVDLDEFLTSIRGGIKLRKTVTNDKSGLIVDETMLDGGLFKKEPEPSTSGGAPPPPPPPPPPCVAPPPPPPPSGVPSVPRERKEANNPALKKLGGKTARDVDLGEFLNSIKGGIKLRKAETNDKSGLIVDDTMLHGDLFQKKEGVVPEISLPDFPPSKPVGGPPPPPPPPPGDAAPPPPPPSSGPPPAPKIKKEVTNAKLKNLGGKTAADVDMGALLNNIKGGIKLRKVETKDRSGLIVDETMTSGAPLVRIDNEKLAAAKPKKPEPEEEISEEDAAALLAEIEEKPVRPAAKKPEPPPEPKNPDFAFDEKNLHITSEDIQKECPTGKAAGMRALWSQQITRSPSPAPQQVQCQTKIVPLKDRIAPPKAFSLSASKEPEEKVKKSETTSKTKSDKKGSDAVKEIKRLRNAKLKKKEQSVEMPDLSEADAAALLEELEADAEKEAEERCQRLTVNDTRTTRAQSTPATPQTEEERVGFDEKSLHVTKEDLEKEIPLGKAKGMRALFDHGGDQPVQPFLNNHTVAPAPKIKLQQSFVRKDEEERKEAEKKKTLAPVQRKKKPLRKQDSDFDMPELSEADAAALLAEMEDEDSEEEKSTADACYDEKSLHITHDDLEKEIPSGKAAGMRALFDTTPSTSFQRAASAQPELGRSEPRRRILRDTFVKRDSEEDIAESDADFVGDLGKITKEDIEAEVPTGTAASRIAMWAGREHTNEFGTIPRRISVGRLQTPDILLKMDNGTGSGSDASKGSSKWAPVVTSGLARQKLAGETPRATSALREITPQPEPPKKTSVAPTSKKEETKQVKKEEKKTEIKEEEVKAEPRKRIVKKKTETPSSGLMSFAVEPKKEIAQKAKVEEVQAPRKTSTTKSGVTKTNAESKTEEKPKTTPIKKKEPVAAAAPLMSFAVEPKKTAVEKAVGDVSDAARAVSDTGKKRMEGMAKKNSREKKSQDGKTFRRQDSKRHSGKRKDKPMAKVAPAPVVKTEEPKPANTNPTVEKAKPIGASTSSTSSTANSITPIRKTSSTTAPTRKPSSGTKPSSTAPSNTSTLKTAPSAPSKSPTPSSDSNLLRSTPRPFYMTRRQESKDTSSATAPTDGSSSTRTVLTIKTRHRNN